MNSKPLTGIRILDLSRILAGPWCSQHLADLGAEVIKVEHPVRGDDTRHWGPPWLEGEGEAAYFLSANRGKQSVAVDIATPEGQAIVQALAKQCDVVLENFKVGGLKAYGLDYASLSAINPGLIYCSITGFGQDGPYAHRAGYDFMIQGMGGLMSLTGLPDDQPGGGPMKVGVAVTDLFTGMYAGTAILGALFQRERSGEGTHIDLALLDVQVGVLANQALNYLVSGQPPGRMGNAHPNIVPYQAFATEDGHVILAVGNDSQFRQFCRVAGQEALADDPRFATNRERVTHRDALLAILEPLMQSRTSQVWLDGLEKASVPCGPINKLDAVFDDPQVRHRGMRLHQDHPQTADLNLVGNPVRYDGQPQNADAPPPLLGQHTDEVLGELLGYTSDEMTVLRERGVIR